MARAGWRSASRRRARAAGFALAGAILCGLTLLQIRQIPVTLSRGDPRYRIYRVAGEWLRANAPADARVGALEVGVIGYFARRPMVDFAGLLQPDVAQVMRRETSYEDTALYAVERYQPEWVVQLEGQLPRFADYVQTHCSLRLRLPARRFRYRNDLLIHECPR